MNTVRQVRPQVGLRPLRAIAVWIAVELAVRLVLFVAVGIGLMELGWIPRTAALPPEIFTLQMVMTGLALVILGWFFGRRLAGYPLGYRWDRPAVLAGILGGVLLVPLLSFGTHHLDQTLTGKLEPEQRATVVAWVLQIVANGVLAPVVEEFFWRGYIQGELGFVKTALFFAAKHVVVDFSLARPTTLLTGSFALGWLRLRWGTAASTIAHLILNLTASIMTPRLPG